MSTDSLKICNLVCRNKGSQSSSLLSKAKKKKGKCYGSETEDSQPVFTLIEDRETLYSITMFLNCCKFNLLVEKRKNTPSTVPYIR